MWFEEWCEEFHEQEKHYDAEPLFDPLVVFFTGNEHKIEKLKEQGINPRACQYLDHLGGTGCRISWDKRPSQCKTYVCKRLEKAKILEEEGYMPLIKKYAKELKSYVKYDLVFKSKRRIKKLTKKFFPNASSKESIL